jgi:hypothetical protein
MNESLYLEGKSSFTLENNINVTGPEGEVCFGNTITSCLTYCVIFENNTKISVHINPATNIFSKYDHDIQINEVVNVFNVLEQILKTIIEKRIIHKIKKIILLAESELYLYKYKNNSSILIGNSDVEDSNEIVKYNSTWSNQEHENMMTAFIKLKFFDYIKPNVEVKFIKKTIEGGSIYFVKSDSSGHYFSSGSAISNESF